MNAGLPTVLAHALVQMAPPQSVVHQIVKANPDPRGPLRKVIESTNILTRVLASLECGHTAHIAPHFSVAVGSQIRCYACGQEAKAQIVKSDPLPVCDPLSPELRREFDRIFLMDRDPERLRHPFLGDQS